MKESVRAFAAAWTALKFWFLNLPALLRLTWFPLTLLSLVGYGWHYWSTAADIAHIEARGGGRAQTILAPPYMHSDEGVIVWALLQLVALSAAAVAVHRFVVAGERRTGEFFTFAFGKAERAYFAMGLAAYVLMTALVAGQHLAQLELPALDVYLVTSVLKPYGELGPWVLSMFAFPGELPIFEMPPLNYALWCALVVAAGALVIRIAPWPATVAADADFALGQTFALTHGRTLTVVTFFAAVGIAAALAFALLGLAGLSSLAFAGPDALGHAIKAIAATNDWTASPVENVEIRSILNDRTAAFYQEITRFLAGLMGVTLGATLLSHLYLTLDARTGWHAVAGLEAPPHSARE